MHYLFITHKIEMKKRKERKLSYSIKTCIRIQCYNIAPCIRGVAVTPADANCTTEWARTPRRVSYGAQYHRRASNVNECQKACEFDPRCVAVDWRRNNRSCWINRIPNHTYRADNRFGKQYKDVSVRVAGCISC